MHISDLRPVPGSVHKKKRVGRGNASRGTTGGRGTKGQQSRSGPDLRIGFEGGQNPLVRSLSRKRGFNNKWRVEFEPVNVGALAGLAAGSDVTPESLRAAGIVKSARMAVKILGDGDLGVKLNVSVDHVSAAARAKIEAVGGSVTETLARKEAKEGKAVKAAPAASSEPEAEEEETTKAED